MVSHGPGMPFLPWAVDDLASSSVALEVLICDDGSRDGSTEWLETLQSRVENQAGCDDVMRSTSLSKFQVFSDRIGFVGFLGWGGASHQFLLPREDCDLLCKPSCRFPVAILFFIVNQCKSPGMVRLCSIFLPIFFHFSFLFSSRYRHQRHQSDHMLHLKRQHQTRPGFARSLQSVSQWKIWIDMEDGC